MLKLISYDNDKRQEWQDFVKKHGFLYHDIRWKDIIEETYGLESRYLMMYDDQKLVGLFPSFINRNQLISIPYCPYAGILLSSKDVSTAFYEEIIKKSTESKLYVKEIIETSKSSKEDYVTMIKKLDSTGEIEFKNLKSRLRNKIRNALKNDFLLKECSIESYYKIYLKATNALGTPGHKKEFFVAIKKHFGKNVRINGLYLKNEKIGVMFEIDYKDTRYDLWIFSLKEYFSYQPNVFLYWKSIENAIENGLKYYDFGRSVYGKGTYLFKKQWNAVPVLLKYKTIERKPDGKFYIIEQDSLNGKLVNTFSKTWSKLPEFLTNSIGPLIRKKIY